MAKSQLALKLNVFLNTRHVGCIQRKSNGAIEFNYDDSWLNFDKALPISLSLPLSGEKYIGDKISVVLDNLLPDNTNIRRRIATKTGAKSDDVIDLLAVLGQDCVGALRFTLDENKNVGKEIVEGKPLSNEQIADKIKNLKNTPLGIDIESEFRISIAGAQEKTALLFFNKQWMEPIGTTATTHILKPQIGKLSKVDLSHSVENEHFCLEFLKNLGLNCAQSQIIDFNNVRTLVVERFDRQWMENGRLIRLPQEDCCQVFGIPSTNKYENNKGPGISEILTLLNMSDDALFDREFFFKTQIVYWLLAATDAHAKNYSIALYPGGKFRLTPLYDVMSVQPYFDLHQIQQKEMRMAMALVGKNKHYKIHEIVPRHFIETGKVNGISQNIIENMFDKLIIDVPKALKKTTNNLFKYVPESMINSISNGVMERLSLLRNL